MIKLKAARPIHLVPSLNKEYKNKAQLRTDLMEQKDFTIDDAGNPLFGWPINLREIKIIGYDTVLIKHTSLERVAVFSTEDLL